MPVHETPNHDLQANSDKSVSLAVQGERLDNALHRISRLEKDLTHTHARIDTLNELRNTDKEDYVTKSRFGLIEKIIYGGIFSGIAAFFGYVTSQINLPK